MTSAELLVERAGPLVTIQDAGRPGFMRYGVPLSGPMDGFAATAANASIGQDERSPLIEISVGGLRLRCVSGSVSVGICGGAFAVTHAHQRCAAWCVRTLRSGEVLDIAPGDWGSWCYVAFSGELQCEHWLRSAATHARTDVGGGHLVAGQTLVITDPDVDRHAERDLSIPKLARPLPRAHVLTGPRSDLFSSGSHLCLAESSYLLSDAYDRMGVRLAGPPLTFDRTLDEVLSVPSQPVLPGSLQVSGDGVATLLLRDHQTTGGYPVIATVLSCEVDQITQLRTGQQLRFDVVEPDAAIEIARTYAIKRSQELQSLQTGRSDEELMTQNLVSGFVDGTSPPDESAVNE